MITKEQERQAITKIKKIVEGMGENSYLATAMEGVLETAEENIEYDAAFSLKGRAELAEKSAYELNEENEELKKKLDEAKERADRWESKYNEACLELERCKVPEWAQKELEKIVENGLLRTERKIKEAADEMADAIGEDGNFAAQAVEQARRYKEQRVEQIALNHIKEFLTEYKKNEQQ
ncbi:hypothetical protein [Eisenbergiella sp.]